MLSIYNARMLLFMTDYDYFNHAAHSFIYSLTLTVSQSVSRKKPTGIGRIAVLRAIPFVFCIKVIYLFCQFASKKITVTKISRSRKSFVLVVFATFFVSRAGCFAWILPLYLLRQRAKFLTRKRKTGRRLTKDFYILVLHSSNIVRV